MGCCQSNQSATIKSPGSRQEAKPIETKDKEVIQQTGSSAASPPAQLINTSPEISNELSEQLLLRRIFSGTEDDIIDHLEYSEEIGEIKLVKVSNR